ncbi:DNA topoisomerase 1 beta-like isoform X2 [Tripterygium wilfordii]|uniref:DNA topoisomerase 1 beta-like isoform X2 n=1 Tax=Tripterygium wilfordii TaxID=458696 RepID=UPI0018F7EC6D|nr:DNA topoisomerase 1 beta-like isoform X2 [Tripterygium wilfordii]
MAVEASSKRVIDDFDDDDDKPLIFRRSNNSSISKKNQLNQEIKKSSSTNGQTSNPQRSKVGPSSKASPTSMSPLGSPKPAASSVKASPVKSPPMVHSKVSASLDDRSKHLLKQNASIDALKREPNSNSDSEDSEDDKPLSARLMRNTNNTSKGLGVSPPVKSLSKDSDDEVPLSSKFAMKSGAGTSGSKFDDYEEKKPLTSGIQQNGSVSKEKQQKSAAISSKRPLDKIISSDQSSAKKAKLSDTTTPVKIKQVTVKGEGKRDDDDHIPISQRIKKSVSSDNKSSTTIKKVTKVVSSSSKKITKNSKQVLKNSKYSQSTKVSPSSGDGQKKWTTLVHNGVIFPPPYKPHGIKMLYKGQPVALTPAQEEEKKALKEEKLNQEEKYMWAVVDGVKEKVGNFRVEPPGLFRGRGEHPKMGKLKRRIRPSDITMNIGKDAPIPECPIPGERWKEVKHDNTVTWLAFWNDPINPKEFKYVFLAASSSLKGQSDKEKYEKARKLKDYIENIRTAYTKDFTSKDVTRRQIAVATYLIDKLALRAGNEKDDDEADTVGCCTLKVGNVECVEKNKLKFDFLGKDSIQYVNTVEVELPVYKAIKEFQSGKRENDDLFDKLDTSKLNAHLKDLMPGLTAKVFRTYNASITLDSMLSRDTKDGDVAEKVVVYQHANKEVAIICNHQRTVSKSHSAQILRLTEKIEELKGALKELKIDLDRAKKGKPPLKDAEGKQKRNLAPEAIEKKIAQTNGKIEKMERDMHTKEDLKTVALGTSKINYLDPRITVAWCKRHEVPIEKIFNKSLLAKFAWSMDVDPQFRF